MLTLTYGLKKPQTGDLGSDWFGALEDNIQQLDSHSHNGTDSPKLLSSSVEARTTTVSTWSATTDGMHRATVNLPAGMSFDKCAIVVKDSTGDQVHVRVERVSASQVYLHSNLADTFTVLFVS